MPKVFRRLFAFAAALMVLHANVYGQANDIAKSSPQIPATVWKLTLEDYLNLVDQKKPAITGGCVTLTSAAFATTLFLMALKVSQAHSVGINKGKLDSLTGVATIARDSLAMAADTDNYIFQSFLEVYKLPYQTPAQKRYRDSTGHLLLIKATASTLKAAGLICPAFKLFAPAEQLSASGVFSDVKSSETLLDACFRALVILTRDNIGQLPTGERPYFQTRLDALITQQNALFNSLNNPH